jgi:hypothetical protein
VGASLPDCKAQKVFEFQWWEFLHAISGRFLQMTKQSSVQRGGFKCKQKTMECLMIEVQ